MKKTLALLAMLLPLLCTSSAYAANSQQTKMAACNKDATGKKGDERKAFMKQCLSAKADAAPAAAPTQQDKMKTCAASGKGKKGDDYKAFMKDCLSNKG